MVTWDSWVLDNKGEGSPVLKNCSFEPYGIYEFQVNYNTPYPHDNDTNGYGLEHDGGTILSAQNRFYYDEDKEDVYETVEAKGIMIHVGGFYKNEKDPTFNNRERIRAGGSAIGGAAGAWAGAEIGAVIGTAICPGVGTVIGGVVGAVAGGVSVAG